MMLGTTNIKVTLTFHSEDGSITSVRTAGKLYPHIVQEPKWQFWFEQNSACVTGTKPASSYRVRWLYLFHIAFHFL